MATLERLLPKQSTSAQPSYYDIMLALTFADLMDALMTSALTTRVTAVDDAARVAYGRGRRVVRWAQEGGYNGRRWCDAVVARCLFAPDGGAALVEDATGVPSMDMVRVDGTSFEQREPLSPLLLLREREGIRGGLETSCAQTRLDMFVIWQSGFSALAMG